MRPSVSGRSDHPETVVPWNGSPEIAARRASRSRPSTTRRGIPAFAITRAPTGSKTILGPAREWPSPVRAINFAYGIRSKRCANGNRPAERDHDPFHGDDRVRIPALRKYLPSGRGITANLKEETMAGWIPFALFMVDDNYKRYQPVMRSFWGVDDLERRPSEY